MTHLSDETLSAWIEGELAAGERAMVEEHVGSCDQCRGAHDALRDVIRRAAATPEVWPDKARVWDGIALRIGGDVPLASHPPQRWRLRHWAVGLAAAGVLALLVSPAVWQKPDAPVLSPAVSALLALDREVHRELTSLATREDLATPLARQTLLAADRTIDGGVDALTRALRDRPDDPVLTQLLGRAVEQRARLLQEVTP